MVRLYTTVGEGRLCPTVGTKEFNCRETSKDLTAEGYWWASPAVDCLGPGQSCVGPHHGDSDAAGLPSYFKLAG